MGLAGELEGRGKGVWMTVAEGQGRQHMAGDEEELPYQLLRERGCKDGGKSLHPHDFLNHCSLGRTYMYIER